MFQISGNCQRCECVNSWRWHQTKSWLPNKMFTLRIKQKTDLRKYDGLNAVLTLKHLMMIPNNYITSMRIIEISLFQSRLFVGCKNGDCSTLGKVWGVNILHRRSSHCCWGFLKIIFCWMLIVEQFLTWIGVGMKRHCPIQIWNFRP